MTTNIVKLEEGRAIGSNRDVPLSDHEAEALGHLAVALSGISTTIRSAAYKHALNSSHAMKPLKETEDALTDYDALARAAGRKQPKAAEEDDRKGRPSERGRRTGQQGRSDPIFPLEQTAKGTGGVNGLRSAGGHGR